MMDKKQILFTGLSVTGLILGGSVVYGQRKKSRDRKAVGFFGELERQIAPGSAGIIGSNAFDIYYWQKAIKKFKPIIKLKDKAAKGFAQKIQSAWGIFNDDENQIKSVFRALKDKVQISQVAYWYWKNNEQEINLIDELRSRLSKEEVAEIMEIVKPKKSYREAKTK